MTDDELAKHLVRRGARATPRDLAHSVAVRVAETKREPSWRRTARSLRPVAALAACVVVVLVSTLIATAPRPNADGGPGSTTVDPAMRPLTVAEFVRYVQSGHSVGKTVVVDDAMIGLTISCPAAASCPIGYLSGFADATHTRANTASWVYPPSPNAPTAAAPIAGPLALRIRDGGGFTLLGQVHPHLTTRLAWSVSDVQGTNDGQVDVVHGWLGATSIEPPCVPQSPDPAAPRSVSGDPLDYACGQISFIADTATTTETALPASAIRVQNLAYVNFAKGPVDAGASGPVPAIEGDYLVRSIGIQPVSGLPSGAVYVGPETLHADWELIARLDPVKIPAADAATPAPTPTAAGPIWDPTQRPLTPPEFLRVLGTHPAPGTILIVDDGVVPSTTSCASAAHCPTGALQNSLGILIEPPPGGVLTFTTDPSTVVPAIPGPIALQVTDGSDLVFLGTLVGNGQHLAVTAHDLAARNAMGGLFVVPAWIVAGLQPRCPAPQGTPTPGPTSEVGLSEPNYGCAINNWLTDSEYQPDTVIDNGNSVQITMTPPPDGFAIQLGAYQNFAPDPADDGHGGTLPRQGVFLVRDWAGRGEVLGRLAPMPIPPNTEPGVEQGSPAPTPQSPAPTPQPTAAGPASPVGSVVWPLGELASRLRSGTIPSGTVVVTDIAESDLTPAFPAGVAHSCPQHCTEWFIGPSGQRTAIVVSMLSPEPTAHIGRLAFLVEGDTLRLLGPLEVQPDGHPFDVATSSTTGGFVAVHGWLRDGLPVPCPALPSPQSPDLGLDQQPLLYTCPGTWIQPTSADPQVLNADGSGSIGMPAGSALVQDGADGSSQTAREGTFLIRRLDCFYPAQNGCQAITD
ncbi:MAG TPA: hypothetical protein VK656_01335, partial [Candidatus Acidoferrum sp.]|nr:hypothetical protein [Candidatus Acidoferrum sp.]